MAGVYKLLFRPQKERVLDRKAMELEAAREILAEVFGVGLSEVDEMICSRVPAGGGDRRSPKEDGLWPQEFWVEG